MTPELRDRLLATLAMAGKTAQGPTLDNLCTVVIQLAEDHGQLAAEMWPWKGLASRHVASQQNLLTSARAEVAQLSEERIETLVLLRDMLVGEPEDQGDEKPVELVGKLVVRLREQLAAAERAVATQRALLGGRKTKERPRCRIKHEDPTLTWVCARWLNHEGPCSPVPENT